MATRLSESSVDLPHHLQWTLSKEVFQKMVSGASWLSRSHNTRYTEQQPLVNTKARNYSCNEIYTAGRSPQRVFPPPLSSSSRPMAFSKHFPLHNSRAPSVNFSDVCRTATPMIPIAEDEEGDYTSILDQLFNLLNPIAVFEILGVSWVTAAFLLLNAALGIGILNFPAAYNQAGGILSATVIQLIMLVLIVLTMLILAYCSDVNLDVTYHDVLLSMCGRKAQKLAALSITCTCYGVCVAILIIIGDQMDRLLLAIAGPNFCHTWYLERHFTIPATSLMFVLPICYFKRVDFLRHAGSLGIVAMLYPVFLTVYGYFKLEVKDVDIKTEPDSMAQVFVVVPVLCFAYQCQEVVVPVYACMRERTLPNFFKSCCLAMTFLLVVYSIIGCFGYMTFGSMVTPNVMKMYDASDPVVMIGIGALILKMVVTYPVLALCGRGAVDGLYAEFFGLSAAQFVEGERRRRVTIASIWFSSSLLLALYTSSIGTVIHALGSVSSANIFIYPGICLIRVVLQTDKDLERPRSIFLILGAILLAAFGAFCFGVILVDTILNGSGSNSAEILCS